jgi:hypothetical protein
MIKFCDLSNEDKIFKILNSIHWKRIIEDFNIPIDRLTIITDIISKWELYQPTNIKTLARLVRYADITEITENFNILNTIDGCIKRKRTPDMMILQFGKKEGVLRYEDYISKSFLKSDAYKNNPERIKEYKETLSKASKKRIEREGTLKQRERSKLCKEYWLKQGLSEIESLNESKKHSLMLVEKSKGVKSVHKKENKPNTLIYWISRGYSIDDAIINKQKFTDKSIVSKEKYKERYGDEWESEWNKTVSKKQSSFMKTLEKRGGFKGNASKMSLKYFIPLREILITKYNISEDDIYLGIDGSKEFFLANSKYYYFRYDFTIRSKKIIIDFHGDTYHPSIELLGDDWVNWVSPYGITAEYQHNIDINRELKAKDCGYAYYVIWSYKNFNDEFKNVLKFIEGNL